MSVGLTFSAYRFSAAALISRRMIRLCCRAAVEISYCDPHARNKKHDAARASESQPRAP